MSKPQTTIDAYNKTLLEKKIQCFYPNPMETDFYLNVYFSRLFPNIIRSRKQNLATNPVADLPATMNMECCPPPAIYHFDFLYSFFTSALSLIDSLCTYSNIPSLCFPICLSTSNLFFISVEQIISLFNSGISFLYLKISIFHFNFIVLL